MKQSSQNNTAQNLENTTLAERISFVIDVDNQPQVSFLMRASSRDILLDRLRKIMEVTWFTNCGFDCDQRDSECRSLYKIVMIGHGFEDIKTIKKHWNRLCKFGWFYENDSCLLQNGEYLFSEGKWYV